MIRSGLKKLAKQHNMTVSNGLAYGSLMGYATTISESSGCKLLEISTTFPELAQKEAFYAAVNAVDLSRTYRVQNFEIGSRCITINFLDNPGTMKKLEAFIAWFYPLLAQYGATGANICAHCGSDAAAGGWYLVNGIVHRFHDSCAEHLKNEINGEKQEQREQDDGSYVQGFFGALIGALLGSAVWAIVYAIGYVASVIGLLMGWLAEKGYNLLHGKQGKGKVAILIIAIILGIIIGNYIGLSVGFYLELKDTLDLPSSFTVVLNLLLTNAETQSAFLGDIALGLLFGALGVFVLIKNAAKQVADVKFKKLG